MVVLEGIHHRLLGENLQPGGDVGDHQVDPGEPVKSREKLGHFRPTELAVPSQLVQETNLEEDCDGSKDRVRLSIILFIFECSTLNVYHM